MFHFDLAIHLLLEWSGSVVVVMCASDSFMVFVIHLKDELILHFYYYFSTPRYIQYIYGRPSLLLEFGMFIFQVSFFKLLLLLVTSNVIKV